MVKRIKITDEMWEQIKDKCFCTLDVYRAVGLYDILADDPTISLKQLTISEETHSEIRDILKDNVRVSAKINNHARKEVKRQLMPYDRKIREQMIVNDWNIYSPRIFEDVPLDEIWLKEKMQKIV